MCFLNFTKPSKKLILAHLHKAFLVCFLFLFSFQNLLAQSIISGKITDTNNQSIPFAHIIIENTNKGTIANDNGEFKLLVNEEYVNNRLMISSIGYKTKKIALSDEYLTITLTEDITQLNEVVILSKDYAKELVKKAINAIPNNYPTTSERHTGFFRETTTRNNEEKPIYIAEAVVEAIKEDYTKRKKSGDVKLIEFRKYESDMVDSLPTKFYAGSHHIHRFDMISRREAFLSKPDAYKYRIVDTLRQDGKDIYKVFVKKKNENSAYVYIQEETFAIVKAEIKLSSNFGILGDREFFNFTVTYKQGNDKLWRFNNSNYQTAFKKQGKIINLKSEYVTTDIEANEDKIPYIERLQFSDIILDETKAYNPNFWNNYTIISPNEISESLFESIDYSAKADEDKQSEDQSSILKKMSFEFGFTWTAFDIASNTINYTNSGLDIQRNNDAINRNSLSLTSSAFYPIKSYFLIGFASEIKISRTGITANDLVIAGKFNLNPNGRPISLSPRLHFGYQQLDYFLQRYDLNEDIKIDGKRIKSDKVDAFLSQRGFHLKPSLFLHIEQSNRIGFFISAAYNLPLNNKNGLSFRERGKLFPERVFLKNGQENLSIASSKDHLFNHILSINAGVTFKL